MRQQMLECKLIAILRDIPSAQILPLADALMQGGISCMEIPFSPQAIVSGSDTLRCIQLLRDRFPSLLLGAGTVVTTEMAREAKAAGASFMVSPNIDEAVIYAAKTAGLYCMPGAFTPTEVFRAHQAGADAIKLFPAGILGPAYLRALRGPMPHLDYFVVGGVTPENLPHFLAAGAAGAGTGAALADTGAVAAGRFDEITQKARRYSEAAQNEQAVREE